MYKFLIFLLIFINNLSFSFEYKVQTHAKRTIIKTIPISKTEKYISFILEGTWTDNLGNFGIMEQSSFVMLKNDNVIELDGYGKTIYQNSQETYFKGYRNRQEKDAGVGESKIINATEELSSLIGMTCPYAVNFFNDRAYAFAKCKITEEQKQTLSKISQ
tara:strand:+ start:1052 stop:1531 length:480 start_codon:yes stop_codon:yes gene_type:complete